MSVCRKIFTGLFVLFCLAAFFILIPALARVNDFGRRMTCANYLRNTFKVIELYRNDSEGAYPESLELLQQYSLADPNRPCVRTQCCGERSKGDEVGRSWDYIYRPPDSFESDRPICWDSEAHRPDQRNVLYSNGEIKLLNARQFIEEMRRFEIQCPFFSKSLDAQWSKAVNGLQARVTMKSTKVINETPIISTYLALRNVSDVANPINIKWDNVSFDFRVVDNTGRTQPRDFGPYDGSSISIEDLVLPYQGTLSFDISQSGLGIPKGKAALVDLGPASSWVIDRNDDQKCYLRVILRACSSENANAKEYWHGSINIPPVEIPLMR